MRYLSIDDHADLNEILDEYTTTFLEGTFYNNNLEFFLNKIYEVGYAKFKYLDVELTKEDSVPYTYGLNLITDYLERISPEYKEDFLKKLNDGTVNTTFHDNMPDAIAHSSFQLSQMKEKDDSSETYSNPYYTSINVGNYKTNYKYFLVLLHEYMHSIFYTPSIESRPTMTREDLCEFFSIYFEFDFINYLKNNGIISHDFSSHIAKRYNDVLNFVYGNFPYQTILFYYKQKYEVIDDVVLEKILQETPISKKNLDYIFNNTMPQVEDLVDYQFFLGIPLAYYFSSKNDIEISKTLLKLANEVNTLTVENVIHKLGSSISELESISFHKIMSDMQNEAIEKDNLKTSNL